MAVLDLTRAKWKQFKADNNLSKSSFFNKADVGPTIEEFAKALEAFKKQPSTKGLMTMSRKSTALKAAFTKFINLKEAKAELTPPAKAKIEKWKTQLDSVDVQLAQMFKKHEKVLNEGDAKILTNTLDKIFPGF
jgi:hypothetical protein